MKLIWMIVAGVCMAGAAALVWRREFDRAFVAAALGIIAWFLNYRVQMREITTAADGEQESKGNDEHEDE